MGDSAPILIAGGGIAGLAAALALARQGWPVRVLEKREAPAETGAGIQIGPNGVKALVALGLREPLLSRANLIRNVVMRSGASGRVLTRLPVGQRSQERFGAPYLALAQGRSARAVRRAGLEDCRVCGRNSGFAVSAIESGGGLVRVCSARPAPTRRVSALIAADGLWSAVASRGAATHRPRHAGYSAYRALVPLGVNDKALADDVALWLAPRAHVVHYPVGRGEMLNVVVIVEEPPIATDWDVPGATADLAPHLIGLAPELRGLLGRASAWRRWPLMERPAGGAWASGRVLTVGDAAHPILPFLAQGAVMALEDAVSLAGLIGRPDDGTDLPSAFRAFEALRRPRTDRVAAASRRNGAFFHHAGPLAVARDAVLRLTPPGRLLSSYDWMYGYGS